jgi:osmotically-inducible protein OsmY
MVSGPLGFGLRYTDQLTRRVRTTLDDRQLQNVDVAIEQRPALRRTIVLTGPVAESDRKVAIDLARAVPGVAKVRWVQDATDRGGAPSGFSVQFR